MGTSPRVLAFVGLAAVSVNAAETPIGARAAPAPHEVEIVGVDYAFRAPATAPAGQTTFRFRNAGTVPHELNISLLRKDATPQQFLAALATHTQRAYREASVGVLFAPPHARSGTGLVTDLKPGRTYMIICINQDTAGAKNHFAMGMVSVLHVEAPASPALLASSTRVDTITAANYAFRYPRTLTAGRHRFAFVNRGTVRHEVVMLLLRKGVSLQQLLDAEKTGADATPMIEDGVGVLLSPPGESPLGFLDVDMLPGRDYTIICTLANDAKSPPHLMLGMIGSIHVAGAARTGAVTHAGHVGDRLVTQVVPFFSRNLVFEQRKN